MNGKRLLKVINYTITTILFVVLLVTMFLVISTKASGGEPSLFGYQIKTVLSGSMEPKIKTGSILSIKEADDSTSFQKGDVITFRTTEDILITHRIVEVNGAGQSYITKGDANNAPDNEPVSHENIIGSYTGFTIPYVGYVMNFANSKEGTALLLVIPGILLLIYSGVTIWSTFRRINHEKKEVEAK